MDERSSVPEHPGSLTTRQQLKEGSHRPTADCSETFDVMAHRFGPTRGEADNNAGPSRPFGLIGSPRADSIMARSTKRSTTRPKIRLQSNSIASTQDSDRMARDEEEVQ